MESPGTSTLDQKLQSLETSIARSVAEAVAKAMAAATPTPPAHQGWKRQGGAQRPKRDKKDLECFRCGVKGHFIAQCEATVTPKPAKASEN